MTKVVATIDNGVLVAVGDSENIGTKYEIPYDLDALTVEQAQTIIEELPKIAPAGYLDALAAAPPLPDEQKWSSAIKEQTKALGEVLCMIAGIPHEAFEALTLPKQRQFVNAFECNIILPLFNINVLQPQERTEFEFEGVRYVNTAIGRDANGMLQPNPDQTAEEWCESNDLLMMSDNPMKYINLFVAVICRPQGEAYDESKARERGQLFKRLPARIAFDCFFSFAANVLFTRISSLSYLTGAAQKEKAQKAHYPRGSRGSFGRQKRALAVSRRPKSTVSKNGK